jgi:hypothetical protein
MHRRSALTAMVGASLSACGSSIQTRPLMARAGSLSTTARLYVTLPSDGQFGGEVYQGSGRALAQLVQSAFQARLSRVSVGSRIEEVDAAIIAARAAGNDLVVVPSIVHWEDRATNWSGIPDRAEVMLTVYDARDGSVLNRTLIVGKGTYWARRGAQPQDLLPEPLADYVAGLF